MNKPIPIITIDGPSGVGKGTIAKTLAISLGWHYLDSGALYRIVGYAANKARIDLQAQLELVKLIAEVQIDFKDGAHLNGERVDEAIRGEVAGERASRVASHPEVRRALLDLQYRFLRVPGLVADGRDMGTTVFADAANKFYLIADAKVRANRRCKQLKEAGLDANIAALFWDIQQRDNRDMNRSDSPLRPAEDAIIIDTTNLSIDEVLKKVVDQLHL